jgi:hypothetical protein
MQAEVRSCPKCKNPLIREVIGWCPIYSEPIFEDGECVTGPDRQMCYTGCKEEFSFPKSANKIFHCLACDNFFNISGKSLNWNDAIGRPDIFHLQTPEEYTDELLGLLEEYDEAKINECLKKKFYIEAIVDLHRHIGEQLRFSLIKKTKEIFNIPLDNNNERYKEIVPLLTRMEDSTLISLSFIYGRIDSSEKGVLLDLNSTRNKFVHAFNKKKRNELFSNKGKLKSLIKNCQKVERELARFVQSYR